MRYSLRHKAVSTYIEVFILIGVAMAGSALVYAAIINYQLAVQGPEITISQASIRQGVNEAIERIVIANTGTVTLNSFTISTAGTSGGIPNAQFYVALTNVATGASITPSPGSGNTGDNSITETAAISPGQSILVSITFVSSSEFTIGQTYTVIIDAPGSALASIQVVAIPA